MKKQILIALAIVSLASTSWASVPESESIREYFTLGAATTTFTFTQPCESADDILVYKRYIEDASTTEGTETLLTETTDYTIAATGGDYANGGVVTIDPALGVNYEVVIVRKTQQSQEVAKGAVTPASLIEMVDRLTRQVQDLQDRLDRTLRLQNSDPEGIDMEIPGVYSRAGTYPYFDADGDLTFVSTVDTSGSVAFGNTGTDLAGAADAAAARGILGLDTTDAVEFAAITGTTGTLSSTLAVGGAVSLSAGLSMVTGTQAIVEGLRAVDATGIQLKDDAGTVAMTIEDGGTVTVAGAMTMAADIAMGTNAITGLEDADADGEAVNLGQWVEGDTAGTETEAAAVAADTESVKMPNGLTIKFGTATIALAGTNVAFNNAFDTACIGVFLQKETTVANVNDDMTVTAYSDTGFSADAINAAQDVFWMAIGY